MPVELNKTNKIAKKEMAADHAAISECVLVDCSYDTLFFPHQDISDVPFAPAVEVADFVDFLC